MHEAFARAEAEELDRTDPLAALRASFVVGDDRLRYLDGNSLGRLPRATVDRLATVVEEEWGSGLVGSWHQWIGRATDTGNLIGTALLGARPSEVLVADSTTVNLFKLATAAVRLRPDRRVVVTDTDNFPTDRYVLQGICRALELQLRWFTPHPTDGPTVSDLAGVLDDDVALVVLSHVAFKSGALAQMAPITAAVHTAGALALWDLSHSAGAVPVDLSGCGVDLAVGCTYKYLNAGPGAPAYLFVRHDLQERLESPIQGWFGQRDQFRMGPDYVAAPGVERFHAGTPPVIGMAAVEEGVRMLAAAGIDRLRQKSVRATELMVRLFDEWLAPLGFTLASPRDHARRGSHVSFSHPEAWRMCRALVEQHGVIPDFREPDVVRFGFAPAYTRYVNAYDGVAALRDVASTGSYEKIDPARARVT